MHGHAVPLIRSWEACALSAATLPRDIALCLSGWSACIMSQVPTSPVSNKTSRTASTIDQAVQAQTLVYLLHSGAESGTTD